MMTMTMAIALDNSNNNNNKQDSLTSKYAKQIRKNRFSPFFSSSKYHLISPIFLCYEQPIISTYVEERDDKGTIDVLCRKW